jgi:hypothetical protein
MQVRVLSLVMPSYASNCAMQALFCVPAVSDSI